jgi:hypothetical protein
MRYQIVGIAVLASMVILAVPEQFVIKKGQEPSKKQSVSSLRDQCCQASGELLEQIPDLLRNIADIQQVATRMVAGYVQEDKKGFCHKATKEQLAACLDDLEQLQVQIDSLQVEISAKASKLRRAVLS